MARLGDKFKDHALALGGGAPGLALGVRTPTLTEISIAQIDPDPDQPRRNLGDLAELATSIAQLGVIQPIIVSVAPGERFRILAGERRFSAAKIAGLSRIPAIVRTVEEHQRLEMQLVENLHRKDLAPFEEAQTYQRLIADFGLSHEALGKRIGKTQVSVTETLKILNLPERIRREAEEGPPEARRVSKTVLLEIARRPAGEQLRLWEEACRGGLTARQLRALRTPGRAARATRSPSATRLRYPVALVEQDACVTVEFRSGKPTLESVVSALEEALSLERGRLSGR